jgi:hypothetical protein
MGAVRGIPLLRDAHVDHSWIWRYNASNASGADRGLLHNACWNCVLWIRHQLFTVRSDTFFCRDLRRTALYRSAFAHVLLGTRVHESVPCLFPTCSVHCCRIAHTVMYSACGAHGENSLGGGLATLIALDRALSFYLWPICSAIRPQGAPSVPAMPVHLAYIVF